MRRLERKNEALEASDQKDILGYEEKIIQIKIQLVTAEKEEKEGLKSDIQGYKDKIAAIQKKKDF